MCNIPPKITQLPPTTPYRQLGLENNEIGPKGGQAILQRINLGTSLYSLDLRDNLISCDIVDLFIAGNDSQVG